VGLGKDVAIEKDLSRGFQIIPDLNPGFSIINCNLLRCYNPQFPNL
jgi:hypothetical protein